MTTTRTITVHAADNIRIDGLTTGPAAGWSWNGQALTHPASTTGFRLTAAGAAKITAAVQSAVRATKHQLTGAQLQDVAEADRATYTDSYTNDDGIHFYVRITPAVPGVTTLDRSDVAEMIRTR